MSGRALALLVHPGARDARTDARLARLLRAHRALADACAGVFTVLDAPAAAAVLSRLPPGVAAVAVGGDGTANLVAQAVLASGDGRAFGVLPLGTGNAFAHSIGAGSLPAAIAALLAGEAVPVDVMRTSHPRVPAALVSISAGFESVLLSELARRRRVSRALGFAAGLCRALRPRTRGVALWLDGREVLAPDDAFFNAGLYAQPCYGFGARVVPDADPADGWAEARVAASLPAYARALTVARRPTPRWRRARFESALPLQVDGEAIGPADLEVEVLPAALTVYGRPAAPRPPARP